MDGSIGLGYHAKWGTLTGSYVHRYETLQLMDEDPAATPFQHVTDNRFNVGLVAPTGGASRIEANVGYDSNRRREFEQAGDTEDEVASGLQNGLWTSDVHYHNNPLGPFVGTIGVQGYHNGGTDSAPRSSSPQPGLRHRRLRLRAGRLRSLHALPRAAVRLPPARRG